MNEWKFEKEAADQSGRQMFKRVDSDGTTGFIYQLPHNWMWSVYYDEAGNDLIASGSTQSHEDAVNEADKHFAGGTS